MLWPLFVRAVEPKAVGMAGCSSLAKRVGALGHLHDPRRSR